MRTPDFLIVGAPKCGTTALFDYLKQHPDIYMPAVKELLYFGSDIIQKRGRLNEEEYMRFFDDQNKESIIGDASAWYLFSKRAAAEIKSACPNAKIIIMLRDPVDMLHSLHNQNIYDLNEDIADFGEALQAEPQRRAGSQIPNDCYLPISLLYTDIAKYADQVERYFMSFGKENVLIIIHDDFLNDSLETYKKVLKFVGAKDDFVPIIKKVNLYKNFKSLWLHRLFKSGSLFSRFLAKIVIPSKPVRARMMDRIYQWNIDYGKKKQINPIVRKNLINELEEDINKLSVIIDRDLKEWLQVDK